MVVKFKISFVKLPSTPLICRRFLRRFNVSLMGTEGNEFLMSKETIIASLGNLNFEIDWENSPEFLIPNFGWNCVRLRIRWFNLDAKAGVGEEMEATTGLIGELILCYFGRP